MQLYVFPIQFHIQLSDSGKYCKEAQRGLPPSLSHNKIGQDNFLEYLK